MIANSDIAPIDRNAIEICPDSTPRLMGGKCSSCGKYFFPYRELCTDCFTKGRVERVSLGPYGSLLSYSVVRRAPGRDVPYAIGYISTSENLVVFAPLVDCDIEGLVQGMRMELVFQQKRDREGREVLVYGYKPIGDGEGEER